jgi:hypothetical protein
MHAKVQDRIWKDTERIIDALIEDKVEKYTASIYKVWEE